MKAIYLGNGKAVLKKGFMVSADDVKPALEEVRMAFEAFIADVSKLDSSSKVPFEWAEHVVEMKEDIMKAHAALLMNFQMAEED